MTVEANIADLGAALESLSETAQRAPQVVHSFVDFLDAGNEIAVVDCDIGGAARAGEMTIRFQPCDRLTMLVAAFRAWEIDGLIV